MKISKHLMGCKSFNQSEPNIKTFRCKLINNGEIRQNIYRAGKDVEEVLERLEMFLWPKGVWEITETDAVLKKEDKNENKGRGNDAQNR